MSGQQRPESSRRSWLRALRNGGAVTSEGSGPRLGALLLILAILVFLGVNFITGAGGPLSAYFVPMLVASAIILLGLLGLVVLSVAALVWRLRRGEVGSQLATRLVVIITVLSLLPATVVFAFSWQYLDRGVDSWFSAAVQSALDQALDVAKAGIDRYRSNTLLAAESIAQALVGESDSNAVLTVIQLRDQFRLSSVTLFSSNNRIIATSSDSLDLAPRLPRRQMLGMNTGHPDAKIITEPDGRMVVRVVVPVMSPNLGQGNRLLYVEQTIPEQLSKAAAAVQVAYTRYHQLLLMREPMKTAFQLSLGVALLLAVLSAVWMGLHLARRLTAPIARLAAGTQAVARGEFIPVQTVASQDELGVLIHSFNNMTRQLARAKTQAAAAQEQAEQRRLYLETVLAQISSGILTFDGDERLTECNAAAIQILQQELETGRNLADCGDGAVLEPFWQLVRDWVRQPRAEMHKELQIERKDGNQTLILHGARFVEEGGRTGFVLVFDDISTLVAAQRSAAWSEVARRLAHEIKNPLTPIQLSAERLRRKYLERLGTEADTLDRATRTIIHQVDSLRVLVDAFSDYARAPQLDLRPVDLNALILDVLELYRGQDAGVRLQTELAPDLPLVRADANRLRQILNNLLRNALDALAALGESATPKVIRIRSRVRAEAGQAVLEWEVSDNGPGFPAELLARVFEPYVTSKVKGSGLGLAIVRRIVEEHGGQIQADNQGLDGGARIVMRFPLQEAEMEEGRWNGRA
ncbi:MULTISPECIES: sensor histidine kinase [Acidithiobacillus]|uniref:histidine kinase n=3 Tax=Acidithiobacillus caldus TaxID=33059 RepID=F9ZT62_ACICS|nr:MULTISPECIES: ATP-binding protein [Acidithiobacillus]AEK56668.1 Signal transduction histidine kinase, NtrY [Acidithiobacillus caldus SM-1]AIA53909.1 Nitrogen regulation protein NtrY [Acidithiobacillus caldus ATCC 51756]AUW31592.1 HAMP domain-containing protein [Acidithiobacillus caldus]MBU2730421.1 HAMP domain-containing protein [Acidithiobacillus caldus]MBU2736653.1 HAMP domain-containing protein [Acidithiobacillus caldus ATCC 51756]